jgi:hypothetical protein
MITYKDIKLAVNEKLISDFDYEIQSTDIKEGFKRPSFFVEFDNMNHSSTLTQVQRSLTITIYFFPSDRTSYSLEILDVQERLENLFDLKLSVLDRKFNVPETNSEVTDGVLIFSFDIQYEEGKVVPDVDTLGNPIELMQELDVKRVN